ncbi:MAG: DEAD/DEAH box helicase family protein, partial [Mycoplasmataceae bacterium]|nr:DEAD/DEAH box helicase family protein [Mycoplasmataceae bacterium]
MLKNLNLKNSYTTQSTDIVKEFYIPVFNESDNYDRATGYFSSGILKLYSKGLEYFKTKNGKIRFIMSHEVSESDFLKMKEGYDNIQKRIENQFWNGGDIESREISNLAYLIEAGIVDIKIAFMTNTKGIYHSKFGVFSDKENNLFFNGSNNETYNAAQSNAERFDVTIDWEGASHRELSKIKDAKEEFNRTWNNSEDGVLTINPSKAFFNKINSFNKGELIYEREIIKNNSVLLDFNGEKNFKLKFNNDFNKILETDYFYRKKIKYLVKNIYEDKIDLINDMQLREINELIKNMEEYSNINDFEFYVSNEVTDFIEKKDLEIRKRYNTGIDIKLKNNNVLNDFKSFEKTVNSLMVRKLREQQMWDAFFGFLMQKSFNFSVPGSGKTSVVLAVFAFLQIKKNIKKILMIGPLSSFKSWKDEFYFCFNKEPRVLNLSDYNGSREKNRQIKNSIYENFDLIFINYHSLDSCKESIKQILDNTFVVLDESHKVKSNTGKWSKACVSALIEADNMILLTGTPIPNGVSDLYMQL